MLKDKLEEQKESVKVHAGEAHQIRLKNEQRELLASNILEQVIKIGEILPAFSLIDAYGDKYTNESFKDKKLVLNFFRGSW